MSALTIVMYHYVRDPARTRYPAIRARTVAEFEGQLDYLQAHHHLVAIADVVAASRGERPLPRAACLLTFDDGLLDHYTVVLPRLLARGVPGAFFPPATAVAGRRVLDVHKIQFVLAATPDHAGLAARVLELLDARRRDHALPSADELRAAHWMPSRYDPPETVFVKRVLQRGLPAGVRAGIVASLFEERIGVDEAVFARELYVDVAQLRAMVRGGMDVGGHGVEHVWLAPLEAAAQRSEIAGTRALLAEVHGRVPADWAMCYPFGACDETTLGLVAEAGAALGLTTEVGLCADLGAPLRLPRLDTNDLPLRGDAPLAAWTLEARARA